MENLTIQQRIHEVRGQKVMLDRDIAHLYGVETKRLNEAVRRNKLRFDGDDFMFQLTKDEAMSVISRSQIATLDTTALPEEGEHTEASRTQIATLKSNRGGNLKYLPYAFTELGVAMLSSVLRSETAIHVNREIMRAFVNFRHLASRSATDGYDNLKAEIQALRNEMNDILADQNDINESTRAQLDAISTALAELQTLPSRQTSRRPIGFITHSANK